MLGLVLALTLSQGPVYEERLVSDALAGRERVDRPEGLVVERIEVHAEEVFTPSDPYPGVLNVFHVRTKDHVVSREVLLEPGQPWDGARALETERNLRKLFFIAVARVLAVKGEHGGVVLVVATRDKWSLRLSNDFVLIGPILQDLYLALTEANFLGLGQALTVAMELTLDTLSVSETFVERRLAGSRLYLGETAALYFNRQSKQLEGSSGELAFGQPLISLDQQWGFLSDTTWNVRPKRVYRGASVWQLPYPDASGTPTVPFVDDVTEVASTLSGTRRFGQRVKVDLTATLGGYTRQHAPPPNTLTDEQRAWFIANWLPRSETATYVMATARAFSNDYTVVRNVDLFELSEDFQLGFQVFGGARWAVPLPFAPSNFVELGLSVRERFYRADDLFTVTVAGGVRLRPGLTPANEHLAAELSNSSPTVFGGRLVARVLVDLKANDLDHRQVLLGGSEGLRGTFAEQFSGRNLVLSNVEFRARPFEVLSSWVGLVWFWDAGSAFDTTLALTHTVGLGVRLLLPQLNREVIRVDFGFVFGGPTPGFDRLNASWGQVTDLRPTFLDAPL